MSGPRPRVTDMSTELAESTPAEALRAPASLSPSRASDFMTCPLLYRFRTIDRLPEKPTPDQVRGTLVHAVLATVPLDAAIDLAHPLDEVVGE